MKAKKLTGLILLLCVLSLNAALAADSDTASRHKTDYKNQVNLDIAPVLITLLGQDPNPALSVFYFRRLTNNPSHPLFFRIGGDYSNTQRTSNNSSHELQFASDFWNETMEAEAGAHMQFGKRKLKWYAGMDAGLGKTNFNNSIYQAILDTTNKTLFTDNYTTRFLIRMQITSTYIFIRPVFGAFVNLSHRFSLGAEFNFRLSYNWEHGTSRIMDKSIGIDGAFSDKSTAIFLDANAPFSRVFLSYRF
jgi:hypothetical protein